MLKVFIGVVRFPDDRDFVIMVDGEAVPVADTVRQVISLSGVKATSKY